MSAYEPLNWAMKKIPTLLRGDNRPDTVAHHVLLVLAAHADPDGTNVRPSVATMTKCAHLTTQKSVTDALRRLEEAKLIIRTGELTGGTVVWRLNYEISGELDSVLEDRRERARLKNAERQQRFREKRRNALPERYPDPASNALSERDVTPCQSVSNALPGRESRSDERYNRRSPRLHQPLDQPMTGQGDLFPPTAGAEAPGINAGQIVAGWVEAFTEATGRKPNGGMRGQVGKEARGLLNDNEDPALVLEAARASGAKGFASLEREYAPLKAKRLNGNGRTNSNVLYRNPANQDDYDED